MLQFIAIAGITFLITSYEKSNKHKNKRQNQLDKRESDYERRLEKRAEYNQRKKKSILFKEIKNEQSKLKKERKELAIIRNSLQRNSKEHRAIVQQIKQINYMMDQKQIDADRVRG